MNVTLVRVHEPDAVREILQQALTIANEIDPPIHTRGELFNKAVDLLAARIPLMPPSGYDPLAIPSLLTRR